MSIKYENKSGLPGYDMTQRSPRLKSGWDVTTEIKDVSCLPECICFLNSLFSLINTSEYSRSESGSIDGKIYYYVSPTCAYEAIIIKTRNGKMVEAKTAVLDQERVDKLDLVGQPRPAA